MNATEINGRLNAPGGIDKNWLDTDFPDTRVTEKTREDAKRFSSLVRGSVRVALGRFTTDDELEQRRKRVAVLP